MLSEKDMEQIGGKLEDIAVRLAMVTGGTYPIDDLKVAIGYVADILGTLRAALANGGQDINYRLDQIEGRLDKVEG